MVQDETQLQACWTVVGSIFRRVMAAKTSKVCTSKGHGIRAMPSYGRILCLLAFRLHAVVEIAPRETFVFLPQEH